MQILSFLMNTQVTTLKIKGFHSYYGDDKLVHKFLARQKNIESLALRTLSSDDIDAFSSAIPQTINYKLQQLSLLDFKLDFTDGVDENFLQFLDRHKNSLEILEIGTSFNELVYQLIIGKFKHLNTVHLHVANLPKKKNFYQYVGTIESVKKLIIDGKHALKIMTLENTMDSKPFKQDPDRLLHMIGCFPNVESLRLKNNNFNGDTINGIALKLRQLKHLSVSKFDGYSYDTVCFASLETLHCDNLSLTSYWDLFTKKNQKLNKISIKMMDEIPEKNQLDFIRTITKNLKDLKHLKLGFGLKLDQDTFKVIQSNCKTLKTFEYLQCSIADASIEEFLQKSSIKFTAYETIFSAFNDEDDDFMWREEAEMYFEVENQIKSREFFDKEDFRERFGETFL